MFKSRKNPRASQHDYNGEGVYFITICTNNRIHYFGEINDNKMDYTKIGKTCIKEIEQTIKIISSVDIHEYVIMPNHVHLLMAVFEKNDEKTHILIFISALFPIENPT